MINQEQSREYTRFTKLQQFLDANQTVFAGFDPSADEYADFTANMSSLENLIPGKNVVTKGITTDKNTLKQQVADALGLICRKTYSYALKYNNAQLAAQVNTRPDKILKLKDSGLLGYVTTMADAITPLLTDANYMKYGVTQAQLDDVAANAEAFNNLIGKADVTGSTGTVANTAIDKAIDALRLNVKHFDLLVDEFEAKNPEFVQGYHINSSLDKAGMRHSGVEGYVRGGKDGGAISGAIVKLQNTTKQAVTDLKGYYHIDRAVPDDYMVECSADGYTGQTKLHHINRGKTDEMDWELV